MSDKTKLASNNMFRLTLLFAGAAVGLVLAASGLLNPSLPDGNTLSDGFVARVGQTLIPRSRYESLLSDLAADKKSPLAEADRQFALQRLIDEELLILRGIELGLPESSPLIRKAIAAGLIAQIAAENEALIPADAELLELYESDPGFFTNTSRYRAHWWHADGDGPDVQKRAETAAEMLQNKATAVAVEQTTGFIRETALPDSMLPRSKLADYLGPMLAQQASSLKTGEYSRPLQTGGNTHILLLVDEQQEELPALEQIRPQLEQEYLRRDGDRALREYLEWLRQRTPVVTHPDPTQ